MRLWTLQKMHTWQILQQNHELSVDPSQSEDLKDWSVAYNWMRLQMAQSVAGYQKEHYPWWAWKRPKPDLGKCNLSSNYHSGVEMVRLELVLPKANVVLSNFAAWEMVLGEGYVNTTSQEALSWETALIEAGIDDGTKPLPESWQIQLTDSWKRIFDLQALKDGRCWSTARVQATFEKLRMIDVVDATTFVI